jgi:four helix bundle protein
MATHENLDIWKLSIEFVTNIYLITKEFPADEKYELVSQMRRSAVSIPSNIAEGAARKSDKEFLQFLHISLGSIAELDTQLIIAENLEYLNKSEIRAELKEIKLKLIGYIKYIKSIQKKA